MAKITIAYTAPEATQSKQVPEICAMFQPTNAACDLDVFNNTYYDTNVYGITPATSTEVWMEQMIAYPGVIAALRAAMAKGSYVIEFPTENDILYYTELGDKLEDEGFTITVEGSDSSEG